MCAANQGIILAVDDDPFVLDSITMLIENQGFKVIACKNAAEALEKFNEHEVDAVLTDIIMPAISGIELLEEIHAVNPEMPVILMTAYADLDIAVNAIKKGAFDFIIKPYKTEQLAHSIGKAIKYNRLVQLEKDYKHVLEEFNREMETLVSERTMSLMALTVADRVRNPASTIGRLCRRTIEKENISETVKDSLKTILDEAKKLEDIVSDFQSLLKSRQSKFIYENINEIVASVVSIIRENADSKGVKLNAFLSEHPLKINAQKNLLRVAISHLLRNAIEATPEGGSVEAAVSGDSRSVTLRVSDTGRGIPPEDIGKIFNPFFSTKEYRFGMGLPLVRQIMSEHLGEIKVESEPGKGTTFYLVFPTRWAGKNLTEQ